MRYVVDASVAVKWFFSEEHSAAALRIYRYPASLHAPRFFMLECGNAVCRKIRRSEIETSHGLQCVQSLRRIPMQHHPDEALFPRAMELALITRRGLYDCLYLALAIQLDCPFVTADRRFWKAIQQSEFMSHVLWIEELPE